jgi:oxygen-independent coproporphyrinogen III oxidase
MDHFAKATDPLALAQNQRKLHRNFQGYTTQGDCDLIAFGASSISMLEDTYIQNHTDLNDYEKSIELGQLPISKGYICHKDDTVRRDIILALICHFEVDINAIEKKYSLSFLQYFHHEMIKLIELKADGLLDFDANNVRYIRVTESGRILIRCICMVFDQYLNKQIQYSKVI